MNAVSIENEILQNKDYKCNFEPLETKHNLA